MARSMNDAQLEKLLSESLRLCSLETLLEWQKVLEQILERRPAPPMFVRLAEQVKTYVQLRPEIDALERELARFVTEALIKRQDCEVPVIDTTGECAWVAFDPRDLSWSLVADRNRRIIAASSSLGEMCITLVEQGWALEAADASEDEQLLADTTFPQPLASYEQEAQKFD